MGGPRLCFVLGVIATGVLAGRVTSADPALSLQADTLLATAGYYQLRWDEAAELRTRLVESSDPSFTDARVVYAGPDTARLVSGKPDGDYYYRLESRDSTAASQPLVVSNTLKVTVQHHSLARAFSFFGLGAAVFVATLGLVFFGGRNERD